MHIGCYRVSKILVDGGSSVNILYRYALDWMEDTPKLARKMILPQTPSLLYEFDGSEAHSPRTVTFPVQADPYNVVTKFCIFDVESSYNAILGRSRIYMMRVIPFINQLLKYPTPSGMADIRGDQGMARIIAAVTRKKSSGMTKTSRAVSNKDSPMNKKKRGLLTNSNYRNEESQDSNFPA